MAVRKESATRKSAKRSIASSTVLPLDSRDGRFVIPHAKKQIALDAYRALYSNERASEHEEHIPSRPSLKRTSKKTYRKDTLGVDFDVVFYVTSAENKRTYQILLKISEHIAYEIFIFFRSIHERSPLAFGGYKANKSEITVEQALDDFRAGISTSIEWTPGSIEWDSDKSCILRTDSFRTELAIDFDRGELTKLTYRSLYAPMEEEEREVIMDDEAQRKLIKQQQRKGKLPFPQLSHRAEANRPTVKLGVRVDPDLVRQVKEAAEAEGIPQTEWLERVLRRALEP